MDLKTFHNTVSVHIWRFLIGCWPSPLHPLLDSDIYCIARWNYSLSTGYAIYFLHQCPREDSQPEITFLTPFAIPYLPKCSPLFKTEPKCHLFHEVFINPPDNINFSPSSVFLSPLFGCCYSSHPSHWFLRLNISLDYINREERFWDTS